MQCILFAAALITVRDFFVVFRQTEKHLLRGFNNKLLKRVQLLFLLYNKTVYDKIKKILKKLAEDFPNAKSELKYNNPFELIVALILSAQCTDERVNKITPSLFKLADTPQHNGGIRCICCYHVLNKG